MSSHNFIVLVVPRQAVVLDLKNKIAIPSAENNQLPFAAIIDGRDVVADVSCFEHRSKDRVIGYLAYLASLLGIMKKAA